MRPPPQKSTCPAGTGDFSEISIAYLALPITTHFVLEALTVSQQSRGEGNVIPQGMVRGSQWALAASIQVLKPWERKGKEGKGKCECGLMNNS